VIAVVTAQASARHAFENTKTTNAYELADGKIRRVRVFRDRQEALEAAGLRE
jgi:hypothetical protein